MKLLEPLGGDVLQGQLYSLALMWARIAGHDKFPLPARYEAARHSLVMLGSMLRRRVLFGKPQLDVIDRDTLFVPVRKLAAYKEWRDAAAPTAK